MATAEDSDAWEKLSLEEKFGHKKWNARVDAYEKLTKEFALLEPKAPEFQTYGPLISKALKDSNAVAQEKAVKMAISYAENCSPQAVKRTAEDNIDAAITKGLSATRPGTKDSSAELLMIYIEAEQQALVIDKLVAALTAKQPKLIIGVVNVLTDAVMAFGMKAIPIKPIVKSFNSVLEHRDGTVRDAGKKLAIALHQWIGAALMPQIQGLQSVMQSDLEAAFQQQPAGKPKVTRWLRSQKPAEEPEAAGPSGQGDGRTGEGTSEIEVDEVEEEIDPYELAEPMEIISKLPGDFYTKLTAPGWKIRKEEALDKALPLCETLRLKPGEYAELAEALRLRVNKDSNVILVVLAAKCLTGLAKGLRKNFAKEATSTLEKALGRCKEKKANVVAALRDTMDAVSPYVSMEAISEMILGYLADKSPSVKTETCQFLTRRMPRLTLAQFPKKVFSIYMPPLIKIINETTPEVRDAGFETIAAIRLKLGEKPLAPYLADIDAIKLGKITEKETALKAAAQGARPATAPAAAVTKPAAAPPAAEKKRPATTAVTVKKKLPAKAPPKKPAAEAAIDDDMALERGRDFFTTEVVDKLASAAWKERKEGCAAILEKLKLTPSSEIPTQVVLRTLAYNKGFKDANFQALKDKLEIAKYLANEATISPVSFSACAVDIIDKLGDIKNMATVKDLLLDLAQCVTPQVVYPEVLTNGFASKNPKNNAEALNWLGELVTAFGFCVKLADVLPVIKTGLGSTALPVRTAACKLIGVLYLYVGDQLRTPFEDEKPALLQSIDAEIAKAKKETAPAPTRFVKGASASGPSTEAGDESEVEVGDEPGSAAPAVPVEDLMPRQDISGLLTDEIIAQLEDPAWKTKAAGLEAVKGIVKEAKLIKPKLGSNLPAILKARVSKEKNKVIQTASLELCKDLANAMGPGIKEHMRLIGPAIITVFGDSKPGTRALALDTINLWCDKGDFLAMIEPDTLKTFFADKSPTFRAELFAWLYERLKLVQKVTKEVKDELAACIPLLLENVEDRNPDVRKKATELLPFLMFHTGYEAFQKCFEGIKQSSRDGIIVIVDKARGQMPAKPKAAPPPAKPTSVKGGGGDKKAKPKAAPKKPETPEESDDEPLPAPTSAKPPAKGNKRTTVAVKKDKVEENFGPLLVVNNTRAQRMKDDQKLKTLRWNFTMPQKTFVDQLQEQMVDNVASNIVEMMFHADFKQHLKAIDFLLPFCEQNQDALQAQLDLILRWTTLRFFDTNPAVHIRILEFLKAVFGALEETFKLSEYDAAAFIPYLLTKIGDSKDTIRRDVHEVLSHILKFYSMQKLCPYLVKGLESKNAKQRTECLIQLQIHFSVFQPCPTKDLPVTLKAIASQISDKDNNVRNGALNALGYAFHKLGDDMYKYCGHLGDKERSMLEERLKRMKPGDAVKTDLAPPVTARPTGRGTRPSTAPALANGDAPQKPMASVQPVQQPQPPPRPRSAALKNFDFSDEKELFTITPLHLLPVDTSALTESLQLPPMPIAASETSPRKMLASSEVHTFVRGYITKLNSHDPEEVVLSLSALTGLFAEELGRVNMIPHADFFLVTAHTQLKMILGRMTAQPSYASEHREIYFSMLNGIVKLLSQPDILVDITPATVKEMCWHLITTLNDKTAVSILDKHAEGSKKIEAILRKLAVNMPTTTVIVSLIQLLHQFTQTFSPQSENTELCWKLIWKVIKSMTKDRAETANLQMILQVISDFYNGFAPSYWKENKDTPLRTVKTVLHTLAKERGLDLLTAYMELPERSDRMLSWLRKDLLDLGFHVDVISNTVNATQISMLNGTTGMPNVTIGEDEQENQPEHPTYTALDRLFPDNEELRKRTRRLMDKLKIDPDDVRKDANDHLSHEIDLGSVDDVIRRLLKKTEKPIQ